ncbi:class I SAM-dependent methyltransferase [Paraburkholderia humisilvae]|uniref:Class I SAM-dependent methyltransferase n=1 Tax=Paraburkholderia humisilvae TaxID=627669 RepID=A0A6J5F9L6_9BURK|nr:class I SAM-dependent methyltransferase [Paraburkholderia humisilvae]CAB3774322.1 hypothetical protein LMG29542_07717 [Paraburkholderia humisilvae]
MNLQFSVSWFDDVARPVWDQLIPQINPSRLLEVGSYEGASACYLIQALGVSKSIELYCVDTWEGGVEHQQAGIPMSDIEVRFDQNVREVCARVPLPVEVVKCKGCSDRVLAQLLVEGKQGYFDFIYIDGSHQAPDVLCDAVLGFRLLKIGGVIVFDDYLWREHAVPESDPLRCPKPAIDAFTNLYFRKLDIFRAPLYQLYARKLTD